MNRNVTDMLARFIHSSIQFMETIICWRKRLQLHADNTFSTALRWVNTLEKSLMLLLYAVSITHR